MTSNIKYTVLTAVQSQDQTFARTSPCMLAAFFLIFAFTLALLSLSLTRVHLPSASLSQAAIPFTTLSHNYSKDQPDLWLEFLETQKKVKKKTD